MMTPWRLNVQRALLQQQRWYQGLGPRFTNDRRDKRDGRKPGGKEKRPGKYKNHGRSDFEDKFATSTRGDWKSRTNAYANKEKDGGMAKYIKSDGRDDEGSGFNSRSSGYSDRRPKKDYNDGSSEYKPRRPRKDYNDGSSEYEPRRPKKDYNNGSSEYEPRRPKKDYNDGSSEYEPRRPRKDYNNGSSEYEPRRPRKDYNNDSSEYSPRRPKKDYNKDSSEYSPRRSNRDLHIRSNTYTVPPPDKDYSGRSNDYSTRRTNSLSRYEQSSNERRARRSKWNHDSAPVNDPEQKQKVDNEIEKSLEKLSAWRKQEVEQDRASLAASNEEENGSSKDDEAKTLATERRVEEMQVKLEAWKKKWKQTRADDWLTPRNGRLLDNVLYDLIFNTWTAGDDPKGINKRNKPKRAELHEPSQQGSPTTLLGATAQDAPMPQGYHFVYFPLETPVSKLDPDGADAAHVPPHASPPPEAEPNSREEAADAPSFPRSHWRRLWAGGEITFNNGWQQNLRLDGSKARCVEKIEDVTASPDGRSAYLHLTRNYKGISRQEGWDIEEKRMLAFVPLPESSMRAAEIDSLRLQGSTKAQRQIATPYRVTITPQALHLFQFSALSYNAHAIHYDARYARQVEFYRRPLVHGPLILALVFRMLATAHAKHLGSDSPLSNKQHPLPLGQTGRVRRIKYRNFVPLYVNQALEIVAAPKADEEQVWDVWVLGYSRVVAFKATAYLESFDD
ncbi:hypothetical protein CDD81_565 [Ophiocordyceps australis]|uniref:Uncharacterized protein n=1 Tax=Ophiocordyceps australis TaxID=1399860 RepID=A0A2C5YEY8_9HYPO|nr:hypothetical protein CDD81_565 [Ophiocordyceps australis]